MTKHTITKIGEFIVSRLFGTLVDTFILWLCEQFIFSGYWGVYVVSPAISFEVATFVNFLFSFYWIWRSRVEKKDASHFWHHFWIFNLSCIAGFGVKMVFLLLFERLFGWDVVICNLIALLVSGIANYYLAELVAFRKKRPEPEHTLINLQELTEKVPFFRSPIGRLIGRAAMSVFGMNKLNQLYDSAANLESKASAAKIIDNMHCDYWIGHPERLDSLPEGAFITISNHPYGGLDGIALIDLLGHKRKDYKIMVNNVLARAQSLKDSFITVTPTAVEHVKADVITLHGLRSILEQLGNGCSLGCFPSGAVSDFILKTGTIQDRPWQESMVKLIQKAQVPIVPIRFLDHNSPFYYSLGLIDWRVRILRLPLEFFNKNRGKHRIVIGDTISVEEQQQYPNLDSFANFLRSSVYEMPKPAVFTPRHEYLKSL